MLIFLNQCQPWIDFTKVLCKPLTCSDPKSAKKTDSLTVFSALLGPACVKAACKMLMKACIFCTKVLCAAFFYLHVTREKLP